MGKKTHARRFWLLGLGVLLVLLVLVPALAVFYADTLVEFWWYQSLGLGFYFWQRLLYSYLIFGSATALFFAFFYYNFITASRLLRVRPLGSTKFVLRLRRKFKRAAPRNALVITDQAGALRDPRKGRRSWGWLIIGSRRFSVLASLILALFVAYPLYHHWESALLFLFAPPAGIADPVYGLDISLYLFGLPLFRTIVYEFLLALGILLIILSVVYYLQLRTLTKRHLFLPPGVRRHLSVIMMLIFLVAILELLIQRYLLLYRDSNTPLFFGPGYTDMTVVLPLIWASVMALVMLGTAVVFYINQRSGRLLVLISVLFFVATIGLRQWDELAQTVQDFVVEPDELARQEPYIRNNIDATLNAFDLTEVETRPYVAAVDAGPSNTEPGKLELRNIPVWDRDMLIDVYRELQELRTYYRFPQVNSDRYTIAGEYQQVFVAARELDFDRLPPDSRNWVNRWFKYTHGYGAVMSPAAQVGEDTKKWFLKDIPPQSDVGVTLEQPAIYFGMQDLYDVIAPNALREISYPGKDGVVLDDYSSESGIPIYNWFRRAIFALYYRDYKLFFTQAIIPESKILIRRNVPSTIEVVTPFLELDSDPYLVITPKRLFWIVDAYTLSDLYPYAEPVNRGLGADPDSSMVSPIDKEFNYIRNSVKIVVDAYNGDMTYYLADPNDPIARAYQRMYPSLIKDMDAFPAALRAHIRYPRDLFVTQMQVYAKYHQTDPGAFYGQEDRWMFPSVSREGQVQTLLPYYVTLNLIDPARFEHLLLAPMNPEGRENMRAIGLVSSDGDNYGRIMVYSFPTGALIHGPSQIDALIDQDSDIAEQFTLWGRGGAEIHRGKLILIMVNGVITYVQPVYLKSAGNVAIPQLKRVIVSQNGKVAMEPSLEAAFAALSRKE
ncbi:UPF0182 family protein [Lamprobacter modestohalophilus]|uniref:UPF0182 family protein n=1 Tax=Lamprobacter modestohalophilus TaxID=1064514 RepID=UPI002ADEDBB0|nr:UPF0182 family protein [Lamprobacter modestohalophilus]MEA1048531.1 UPF0182 family protein [Lamprobacter modestohalophilus]